MAMVKIGPKTGKYYWTGSQPRTGVRSSSQNGESATRTYRLKRSKYYIDYSTTLLVAFLLGRGTSSVILYSALSSLVVTSESWNHYAAAVFNARLPHSSVPISRGARLYGKSHMTFISLVVHGLSAIAVY